LIKRIGLIVGIALIFVSFLFFGRQQGIYQILSVSGFVIALAFFLSIILGKGPKKTKLIWTVVVILLAVIQHLTEPYLIDTSYRMYISGHKAVLDEINAMLMQKRGEVSVLGDSVSCREGTLNANEIAVLKEGREKLGVYIISSLDKGVYYGLWGFLDVRLGITYWLDGDQGKQYRHLTGNWFR